jgi:UDP-N-acetylmuramoylalanine--D-glutamate ligase
MQVTGKRVTVFGLERSGLASCELLARRGAVVRASDIKPLQAMPKAAEVLERLRIPFLPQDESALRDAELAVLSPGVPAGLPLFELARERGIGVVGDVEAASWFLQGPILGITGSNGKTTTTALGGHLLETAGVPAQVGGNIGTPLASLVESSRADQWNVLELSSFQLETSLTLRVRVAVVLNVTPDHLDRHGSFEAYADAKALILANQRPEDFAVLNAGDSVTACWRARARGGLRWFDAGGPVERGFWAEEGVLLADGHPFMRAAEIPLRGRHNVENVLAAACAAHLAGAGLDAIRRGVMSFPGVEHRIEYVATRRGVAYYNDSKATNVDATIKALESFEGGLWVILGGKDKGGDYTPLRSLLGGRARAALLIGAAADKIQSQIAGAAPVVRCGTLAAALEHARDHASPGDTVLLAPACASFDQFSSYEHRGRVFKEIVGGWGE